MKKVQVMIMNMPFTFITDDEDRIRQVSSFVDERIRQVMNNYKIVNTLNAVIMAMMEVADEYLEIKNRTENYDRKALRLLHKLTNFESSLRCA